MHRHLPVAPVFMPGIFPIQVAGLPAAFAVGPDSNFGYFTEPVVRPRMMITKISHRINSRTSFILNSICSSRLWAMRMITGNHIPLRQVFFGLFNLSGIRVKLQFITPMRQEQVEGSSWIIPLIHIIEPGDIIANLVGQPGR